VGIETAELTVSAAPDRLIMTIEGLHPSDARRMANQAVAIARKTMPKATGSSAKRLSPAYGQGYFGIKFQDSYVWFQENGIKGFTMHALAGKTIPMWVDDRDGKLRAKNPKIKTKTDAAGKTKVLIFRKAAQTGQRVTKRRKSGERYDAPASYPGAPGRISVREASAPYTTEGRVGGQIARGNGGVRWRHPGLHPRLFLNNALTVTAERNGYLPLRIYAADARWKAAV
jgi:hypothetical protein